MLAGVMSFLSNSQNHSANEVTTDGKSFMFSEDDLHLFPVDFKQRLEILDLLF